MIFCAISQISLPLCNKRIDMSNYLDELNDSQRRAVLYNDGPSLVIAGAGSGKTRVLTYKIAYLLESGYAPQSILALTFTNKAAREMKERIRRQVGDAARYLWMGTFHSIFSRILRTEAAAIGYTSDYTIYDAADSKSLVRSILKEMRLDEKTYKPGVVQTRISQAKNHLVTAEAYAVNGALVEGDMEAKMPLIREVYARYAERCRQSNAMDFDDLLMQTFLLFDRHPDIRRKYTDGFQFVLVDEYQDTNFAQHRIVLQLTSERQKVCVVGDDAQSIYSFRGANIDNILKFTQTYPTAQLFKLEQNYRSTQTIVKAANSLIARNAEQIRKVSFSENAEGDVLKVSCAYSDVEEGEIVANQLTQLRAREHYIYSDFAILYRTNAQSRIFEEALRKRGIPYKIYGGLSFYQRKEIKDLIAYFRLTVNPDDEEAFKRVLNYPARGIGSTTLEKIITAASEHGVSLWQVTANPVAHELNVNKGTLAKLQGFKELIDSFRKEVETASAYDLGGRIVRESGIMNEVFNSKDPENMSRQENIEELLNGMNDYVMSRQEEDNPHWLMADFLSEVSLLSDQDSEKEEDTDKVTLMTIHSAKGLEFRNVFVVGMEEQLFPSAMAGDSPRAMEEERRLCYVAITRAEDHCFLSFARSRFKYGKMEFGSPSRFLREIDPSLLQLPAGMAVERRVDEGASRFRAERPSFTSLRSGAADSSRPSMGTSSRPSVTETTRTAGTSYTTASSSPRFKPLRSVTGSQVSGSPASAPSSQGAGSGSLAAGSAILHERFGRGVVEKVEGTGENTKLTVRFDNAGVKQLLMKFARFKII
jgi:DNA helicase-2/ATP-dependent DNA helicase PcrA